MSGVIHCQSRVVPTLEGMQLDTSQLRGLIDELHTKRAALDPTGTSIHAIIVRLIRKWAGVVLLVQAHGGYYGYGASTVARAKPAIDALQYCYTVNAPATGKYVLTRLRASMPVMQTMTTMNWKT